MNFYNRNRNHVGTDLSRPCGPITRVHTDVINRSLQIPEFVRESSLSRRLSLRMEKMMMTIVNEEKISGRPAVLDENIVEQSALELTQRLGNELGLVESYVHTIRHELDTLSVTNPSIDRRLDSIAHAARTVLDLSTGLESVLTHTQDEWEERCIVAPIQLFEHIQSSFTFPNTIRLIIEIDSDVANVCVFPKLVDEILFNLVSNALDAMPTGGTLRLVARNTGKSVALSVHDSGNGIPEYKQEKLFALFYSTKDRLGLGLWNARRNALLNWGTLTVESRIGVGSVFMLLLPQAENAFHS